MGTDLQEGLTAEEAAIRRDHRPPSCACDHVDPALEALYAQGGVLVDRLGWVKVYRGMSRTVNIPAWDVVEGDLVRYEAGDKIAAGDVRIVRCDPSTTVMQAELTGEPEALRRKVENTDPNPLERCVLPFLCLTHRRPHH